MSKAITWSRLFDKIGKQPLSITQHQNVQIKLNGELKECCLVFDSGTSFHLEVIQDEKENLV